MDVYLNAVNDPLGFILVSLSCRMLQMILLALFWSLYLVLWGLSSLKCQSCFSYPCHLDTTFSLYLTLLIKKIGGTLVFFFYPHMPEEMS